MPSTAEVARELLLWLDTVNATEEDPVDPAKFLAAVGNGTTDTELTRACRRLHALRLIGGISVDQLDRLAQVGVTAAGQQCAEDFGGDIEKWENRFVSKWDQSVSVTAGEDAQVVAHSHHVTLTNAGGDVDISKLAEAARRTEEYLPALPLSDEDKKDVAEAVEGILDEAAKAEPDQGRLRTLGARLKTGVTVAASTGTLGKLIIEALTGAGVV